MASVKTFDQNFTQILAPKVPNAEFLKQRFNFQSNRKTETILLPIIKTNKPGFDKSLYACTYVYQKMVVA